MGRGVRRCWQGSRPAILSTLSRADQEKEMQWFIDAAEAFRGMDIKVVSET
jgi:hypothetical protein